MKYQKASLTLFIFVFSVLSLVSPILADAGDEVYGGCFGSMGNMMSGIYGGPGMIFGWAISLLVLVALVLLIVWLIKQIQKK